MEGIILMTDLLLTLILFFIVLEWQKTSPLVNYIKKRIVFIFNFIIYQIVRFFKWIFRIKEK